MQISVNTRCDENGPYAERNRSSRPALNTSATCAYQLHLRSAFRRTIGDVVAVPVVSQGFCGANDKYGKSVGTEVGTYPLVNATKNFHRQTRISALPAVRVILISITIVFH